jgi:septal ring factor EnvC (AmiA/AmiB activator)
VNRKQEYAREVESALKRRKRAVEQAEVAADKMLRRQKDLAGQIADKGREEQAEKESDKRRRGDLARIDATIKRLERQMAQPPPEFDPLAYNERIVRSLLPCPPV